MKRILTIQETDHMISIYNKFIKNMRKNMVVETDIDDKKKLGQFKYYKRMYRKRVVKV
jgi:hypothetical protein